MQVEDAAGASRSAATGVSPEDPHFIGSLTSELQEVASEALEESEDAASRIEKLEVQLRKLVLWRIREPSEDLGLFWTLSLRLCLHLVCMSEESTEEKYRDLNARKIPFVLLEDIFDCLPVDQSLTFWKECVLGSYETIFGRRIWSPSPTQHPCWLPFLKVTNKLIRRLPPKESARVMLTLCRVYPLAEKSAVRPYGSFNADNVTMFEESDEFEEEQSRIPAESKMIDEEGSVADYSFYESFWKLQEDLNHPTKVDVPKFLNRLRNIITALESHKVSSQTPSSTSRGIKYLTGSHLISYQLTDPEFRIHILTQILIVCHHLSSGGPLLRTKIVDWNKRSKDLLDNMGQKGRKHLKLLESVLECSEAAWLQWKKDKFKDDLDKRNSQPLTSRKRRRTLGGTLASTTVEDEASLALTQGVLNLSELATASKQMRSLLPSLDDHMADYVEALDPDAGIEAEYHPRNDKLFAWRALRVMRREHLGLLQRVHVNGDFEGLVRHIYQEERDTSIPGDYPQYEFEDFEEEEEKEEEEPTKEEDEEDDKKPEADQAEQTNDDPVTDVAKETEESPESKSEKSIDAINDENKKEQESSKKDKDLQVKTDIDYNDTEEAVAESRAPNINASEWGSKELASKMESLQENDTQKLDSKDSVPKQEEPKQAVAMDEPPTTNSQYPPNLDFVPPPRRDISKDSEIDHSTTENGQRFQPNNTEPSNFSGRRIHGGPGRAGEPRGRGDRGRNQPARNERGPPLGRDDRPLGGRSSTGREDRRSPPLRDDRSSATGRGDRGPLSGKGDRGSPPRRVDDRVLPSRRDEYRVPPSGRGRDDQRRGTGGRGGGPRGDDRGPPPERWDDQRGRRGMDNRGDERRDTDDRRGPRRRGLR